MDDPAAELLAAVEAALPRWVAGCVERRLGPASFDDGARAAAGEAGEAAVARVLPRLRALLDADIDAQSTTPLALVREAVAFPTSVLRERGVPPVERDPFAVERFPDDPYDLNPASMADLGAEAGDAAVAWGAAKAWEHRRRHGGAGR